MKRGQHDKEILGNDIAVKAARSGETNPWPDGSVIGKVVWKDTELEDWKAATAPGEFVHTEFMFKDSKKHSETYNWGWARGKVQMGRYYFVDDGNHLRVRLAPYGRTPVDLPVRAYDRATGELVFGWEGEPDRTCLLERQNDQLLLGNCPLHGCFDNSSRTVRKQS